MSKIEKLTDAQRARFPEYVERYVGLGLRTDPADFTAFERAARACYRHAGIAPPERIIRVRSPLVGADLNLKRPVVAGRKVDL